MDADARDDERRSERPSATSSLRLVGRGAAAMLAGSAASAASTFLSATIVARSLPASQAGLFFTGTALFALVYGVCRLGAGAGMVRFLARDRVTGRIAGLRATLIVALLPVIGVALVAALAMVTLSAWIIDSFLGASADVRSALLGLAFLVPFAAVSDVLVSASRGFDRFAPAVIIEKLVRPTMQLVFVAAGLGLGLAPMPLVVAWALPYLVSSTWALVWVRRLLVATGAVGPLGPRPWGDFWRFTWPIAAGSWVQVALQRVDVLLLSALRGPVETAVYVAASRFLVLGQLIGNSFSLTIQPLISRFVAQEDFDEVRRLYSISTAWLVLVSWPLFLSMMTFGPVLLLIFGPTYAERAPVLFVLALAMLVATIIGPVDNILIMAGKPGWVLANSTLALATNVVLNLALIPPLGAFGAAIAWTAAILISNLVPLLQLVLWRGIHPFGRPVALAAVIVTCSFGLLPGLARVLLGANVQSALIGAAAALLVYAVGLFAARGPLRLSESPLGMLLRPRR